MPLSALILAPPRGQERVITGLTLGERARRVAVKAGVDPARIFLVRTAEELQRAASALDGDGPILFVRATDRVVGVPLVEPLRPGEPGCRVAIDAAGQRAGAAVADGEQARALVRALVLDPVAGEQQAVSEFAPVEVSHRAYHMASNRAEAAAADAWQFQLIHKPLDGFLPAHYQRPLARPFTRLFLRLPFSPNAISALCSVISLAGCAIAAQPSWNMHVLGLSMLFFGNVLDACDGEVARLRMEESKFGAWLDAIGDDLARLGLVLALGLHVAAQFPDWPIAWITGAALVLNLTGMGLIYWYCIFVLGSSSNQDYEAVLGVGNAVSVGKKSWRRIVGDAVTTMARRVFIDPCVLLLALLGLSWLSFAGLVVGAVVAVCTIVPAHIRLVQSGRAERNQPPA